MTSTRNGFTLIELSIVIVIIALIIGAVLVGRDLIAGAQLRQVITALDQYRTATITFKSKYEGLPGDIPPAKAQRFGLSSCSSGSCFNGSTLNNGYIDDATYGVRKSRGNSGEVILFWRHLAEAGLINSSVDKSAGIAANGAPSPLPTTSQESFRYIPESPIKGAAFYIQDTSSQLSPFILFDTIHNMHATGVWTHSAALTPNQAFNIDKKTDDGHPTNGLVAAYSNAAIQPTTPDIGYSIGGPISNPTDQYCGALIGPNIIYNTSGPTANKLACGLMFYIREF